MCHVAPGTISDPDTRPGDRLLRKISDFRYQIPAAHKGRNIEGKQISKHAEHISRLYNRFLRDPDFRFQIPKLARFLISDFRLRISDPRTPGAPRQRFQISENRFQRSRPDPTGFRFQISDPSAEQAHVASPRQISECIIQIQGAKKYRLEGPRRRPDHIGQVPMEKMLSPVLLTTNLSVGYVNAFLICLRNQQQRAGQGDETNYTECWVHDAQVAVAYYQLKGFRDQDRYKSVKESARVGGFVEIGEAGPGAVKLRPTPMGATLIRQLTDADAQLAD